MMPTYDYTCLSCDKNFEISQKITEKPIVCCPDCSSDNFKRGIGGGGATLRFEGSGFYITDYSKNKVSTLPSQGVGGCGCGKNSCNR
jgi:putative FmdB family regulatory protein